MTTTQWITVATVAAVVVSALAIVSGLKSVRDQLRVTIFLDYTKRYGKIMKDMPYEAREPGSGYRLNTRDFRCLLLAVVLWFSCSVSVFESVFVVVVPACGHRCDPRVAAGVARGSTVRGPGWP